MWHVRGSKNYIQSEKSCLTDVVYATYLFIMNEQLDVADRTGLRRYRGRCLLIRRFVHRFIQCGSGFRSEFENLKFSLCNGKERTQVLDGGTDIDLLLDWRRALLSAFDINDVGAMVRAVDGTGETGGLRMACQSAGKPQRKKYQ